MGAASPPQPGQETRTHLWLLTGLYSAAHLPLLAFTRARFWDDWAIYGADPTTLVEVFREAGNPWVAHMHLAIQAVGWGAYPFLIFSAFLVTVVGAHRIALKVGLDPAASFWIAAFFAVLPVNLARVAAINLPYGLLFALFVLAWWLLLSPPRKGLVIWRLLVLAGFGLSFVVGSLLVLYAAPLATYWLVRWRVGGGRPRSMVSIAVRSTDLLLLPIAFWVLRAAYFRPEGMFSGYNSMDLGLKAFAKSLLPLLEFFAGGGIGIGSGALVFATAVLLLLPAAMLARIPSLPDSGFPRALIVALAGIALAYLGTFPYLAVGKMPSFSDWTETRHQLTLALGLAVIVYGVLAACIAKHPTRHASMRAYLPLFFVLIFVVNWWSVYAEFYVDYLKQRALVNLIRERGEFRHGNFIIEDATGLSAFNAAPGLNEYAGLHSEAYGSHDALILDYRSVENHSGWKRFVETYRRYLGRWSKTEAVDPSTEPSLYILAAGPHIGSKVAFAAKMLALRVLSPAREEQIVRRMLTIDGPLVPGSSQAARR